MRRDVFIAFVAVCAASACGSEVEVVEGAPPNDETRGILDDKRCPGTFAECDGDAATVCETDLVSSSAHCGGCGNACPDGLYCSQRGCVPANAVAQVIAFSYSTCVRLGAGDVYCWGLNDSGQLGDGSRVDREAPVRVHVDTVAQLFANGRSVCARGVDGSASCWGDIADVETLEPRSVSSARSFAVVDPGGKSTCGILTDGGLVCWGHDNCGGFGDGVPGEGYVADPVPSLARHGVAMSTSYARCVAHRDGRVSCWGSWRALGDGTRGTDVTLDAPSCFDRGQGVRGVPKPVPGLADAVSIVKARYGQCVVHASGVVSCWGDIGTSLPSTSPYADPPLRLVPEPLEGLSNVFKLARFGNYHACALHRDGRVSCWGSSKYYERTDVEAWDPVVVPGLDEIVDVSVGSEHSCVLRRTGEVLCWGDNRFGQLGDRTKTFSRRPVGAVLGD